MPDTGDSFLAPNWKLGDKIFHVFHFLQSDMDLGIENPFSCIFYAISSKKRSLISMPFLLTCIDVRTVKFFPLLNPDWFIQISGALAVCKELTRVIKRHNAIVGKAYSSSTSFHQRANFEKPVHLLNKFWDFEGGSRFLCDMLIFYARVAKSTSGEQGDLCGRGSKNTTGIYDLPVPRPLTCDHILLPCLLECLIAGYQTSAVSEHAHETATIQFETRSGLLFEILTGTHVGSRKLSI